MILSQVPAGGYPSRSYLITKGHMPSPALNNIPTQDNYTDALTVVFTFPKPGFALNVFNAAIYYRLLIPGATGQAGDYVTDALEHYLPPALSNFRDPAQEGFPNAHAFAGIMVRSAVEGTPALVSVI